MGRSQLGRIARLLIDRLSELPILLVISFRADFTAAWIGRSGVSLITLTG